MDPERYFVRPFEDADYEFAGRLWTLVNPEDPTTAEEYRHFEEAYAAPHLFLKKWTVCERRTSEPVGLGTISHAFFSYEPDKFWTWVMVDPSHRGNGIGQMLADLIDVEAASLHATVLWVTVRRRDRRSMEFAEKRGFREIRRLWLSSLDVTEANVSGPPSSTASLGLEGFRFTTLAEEGADRPEVRARLFDLHAETSRDVPRPGRYTPISFEQFVRANLEGRGFLPDAWFLAADGDRYVAVSTLERDLSRKEVLRVGFTGTRGSYRGRGIATELKRRALEYARRNGARYLWTTNDSLNAPIWAINAKQGFRRTVEWSSQERRLTREGPAAREPAKH
jgi:mycothiol synthase